MNVAVVSGYLGKDPEIRYATGNSGKFCYASFNVAVNEYSGKNEDGSKKHEVNWIRVEASGRLAELCEAYLRKGMYAEIEGKIKVSVYKTKEGKTTSYQYVKAEKLEWSKREAEAQHEDSDAPTAMKRAKRDEDYSQKTSARGVTTVKQETENYGFMDIPDGFEEDGLPFA